MERERKEKRDQQAAVLSVHSLSSLGLASESSGTIRLQKGVRNAVHRGSVLQCTGPVLSPGLASKTGWLNGLVLTDVLVLTRKE